MGGVNSLSSSALCAYEFVSARDVQGVMKIRAAPTAYPRDTAAGELVVSSGSMSVTGMEMELSVLRRISNVRNSWGKSLKDAVSTSQKPSSGWAGSGDGCGRSEEHTSELQSLRHLV